MNIHLLPILSDNYAYILQSGNKAAVVDPGEAEPVLRYLNQHGLVLSHILCTHHHGDHIGGATALKTATGATIIGPEKERERIPRIDEFVKDGDRFTLLGQEFVTIETPGHTSGHICYYAPDSKALFSGDTLFSLGCGRLFEGSAEVMWGSLQKISGLPDETQIYCGHEYTESNGRFCLTIEPGNTALQMRMQDVRALRASGLPTLPAILSTEKAANVFLRAGSAERFGELRKLKDKF